METDKDHIHILLQYNPTDSITQIVSTLKQVSAYCAWKKCLSKIV
jgi:putative transposase